MKDAFAKASRNLKIASYKFFVPGKTLAKKLEGALAANDEASVDALLQGGAAGTQGALDAAVTAQNRPVVETLIKRGALPTSDTLIAAIHTGNEAIVDTLLATRGLDINDGNERALRAAMANRDGEMAVHLVNRGANPEAAMAYVRMSPTSPETVNAEQWYEKARPHLDRITRVQKAVVRNPPRG